MTVFAILHILPGISLDLSTENKKDLEVSVDMPLWFP